jgi:hypothetical protein
MATDFLQYFRQPKVNGSLKVGLRSNIPVMLSVATNNPRRLAEPGSHGRRRTGRI